MKIYQDNLSRIAYSSDASVYREIPYGVAHPSSVEDVQELIRYAREHHLDIIPRAGGTSICGQVVGGGIVCDISDNWDSVLEINSSEQWARVQPGVVRDELNLALKKHLLFFSPETSTSNRCCIGGMMGNNSCGTHSLVYGSTRHHVLEATGVLSDGTVEVFKDYSLAELEERFGHRFWEKENGGDSLIERIYAQLVRFSLDHQTVSLIRDNYPDRTLRRRSCGYAIDEVIEDLPEKINLCKLLCGSEGTLAFITEIKVSLDRVPLKDRVVVCAHCNSLEDSLQANLVALRHNPIAVELMDGQILDLSANNLEQQRNRFFIKGDPAALIIAEFQGDDIEKLAAEFEKDVLAPGADTGKALAYCCTRVYNQDISRVWDLRKAGLGVLSGMKGDAKPVGVIEDTAVAPARLPAYIADFRQMLANLGLSCVYYGHISTGELHLRPILNLKDPSDRKKFRQVAIETAKLVRKHKGSLSGEHGDGRLRGEFIPLMYGPEVYELMRQVKKTWDPDGVFNKGKIVDTPPMDEYLRYLLDDDPKAYNLPQNTYYTWNGEFSHGESNPYAMLCSIEQCNGAGVCRRSNQMGGTMCPAFKVSHDELWSTRARCNVLRELLTYGANPSLKASFKDIVCSPEVEKILSTCLSCKGCRSECPSNVDMTRIKAELLQHKWKAQGTPLNVWMIARMAWFERMGHHVRPLYNFFARWKPSARLLKKIVKFSSEVNIPTLSRWSMRQLVAKDLAQKKLYLKKHPHLKPNERRKVYLFADEFTNYQEAELGHTFAKLLMDLGYDVQIPRHVESGRAAISKGCLTLAKKFALKNVNLLGDIISEDTPLVGIEPSCILTFRDEYPDLVPLEMRDKAKALAKNCLLYDEFIVREMEKGNIKNCMGHASCDIYLHGHCHQKSLVGIGKTEQMLKNLLPGATVHAIPSGCCGMAGSFGYEKATRKTAVSIGWSVLFPTVMKAAYEDKREKGRVLYVAAPGTSCRQHILQNTGVKAVHPIEILYEYLLPF